MEKDCERISFDECIIEREELEKVGVKVTSDHGSLFCGMQLYREHVAFYGLRSGEKFAYEVSYADIERGEY